MNHYPASSRRLRRLLREASPHAWTAGETWYADAHAHVRRAALRYRYPVTAVAGAYAAISPGLKWERNLTGGRALVEWHAQGKVGPRPAIETYATRNVDRAIACLDGRPPTDVLSGPKVRAFYRALLGDWSAIVLDGHMANLMRGERQDLRETRDITLGERRAWERAIARASTSYGHPPAIVQAVAWMAHRERGTRRERVPF